jgi:hypothetical protein
MMRIISVMWQDNSHNPVCGHTFIGAPKGKSSEASHITKESTPLSILLLFFAEIITVLVVETDRYYDQFLQKILTDILPNMR